MYACAGLFCVLTNVSNKFVFRRFPLMGGGAITPSAPLRAPLWIGEVNKVLRGLYCFAVINWKAKVSVFKSVFVLNCTYGHESLAMNK